MNINDSNEIIGRSILKQKIKNLFNFFVRAVCAWEIVLLTLILFCSQQTLFNFGIIDSQNHYQWSCIGTWVLFPPIALLFIEALYSMSWIPSILKYYTNNNKVDSMFFEQYEKIVLLNRIDKSTQNEINQTSHALTDYLKKLAKNLKKLPIDQIGSYLIENYSAIEVIEDPKKEDVCYEWEHTMFPNLNFNLKCFRNNFDVSVKGKQEYSNFAITLSKYNNKIEYKIFRTIGINDSRLMTLGLFYRLVNKYGYIDLNRPTPENRWDH